MKQQREDEPVTIQGFYLLTNGKCRVVNHDDDYCFQELTNGHFFGEAEMLKTVDFCFFGNIVADSDDVECMFIPAKDFMKMPNYERVLIKKYAESRSEINMLGMQYSRRYNIDKSEYENFYWSIFTKTIEIL